MVVHIVIYLVSHSFLSNQAISYISSLRSLDLSNNLLCDASSPDQSEVNIRCLAESLRHHHQLQYLSLECIGMMNNLLLAFLDALGDTTFNELSFLNVSSMYYCIFLSHISINS